jgi:hypothetical protein
MSISTADCKKAICDLINSPNGGTVLAIAYNAKPDISEFLKHCWMIDKNGNEIPPNNIQDVIKQAGNINNWKREEKTMVPSVNQVYGFANEKNIITLRTFDCRPFDDQLRAYVWDNGTDILKVKISGE